jgi:hypothetical protein
MKRKIIAWRPERLGAVEFRDGTDSMFVRYGSDIPYRWSWLPVDDYNEAILMAEFVTIVVRDKVNPVRLLDAMIEANRKVEDLLPDDVLHVLNEFRRGR